MSLQTPPGGVIAGFALGERIGRGAMGEVYLSEGGEGRQVALKLLAPELAADERFRRRFLREAQLASHLDHPHVVPTIAFGEEGGVLYIAMAYVNGVDLRQLLRDGAIEPERAVRLLEQVASALDAAHAAGLVHRDVKPANILVDANDDAFVCDFGLARHVSSVGSMTGDRGFVGTIDYVAPEQILGESVDGRADGYALACVLFECLAGARPYERSSDLAVVFAHLNEPPPRISDHVPDLPRALDDLFARALAKSPEDRYATCGELLRAARAAIAGEALPRRRPLRRRVEAAAATAAALVAAAIGLLIFDSGTQPARAAPEISQESIGGVRLGSTARFYKKLLGTPWREDVATQPGFPILIFHARDLSVYFSPRSHKAIIVTTWNRTYRTGAGVGPCSSLQDLKAAYGSRLKPSHWNIAHGKVYGYLVGPNLFFAMYGGANVIPKRVSAVALYDGNGPRDDGSGVDVNGGTQPFAAYIALSETPCTP